MPPPPSRPTSISKSPLGRVEPSATEASSAGLGVTTKPSSRYTVFVRLPFPREDFVDPPPVEWNASKDRVLWETLSGASKSTDLDWKELASKFDVSLPFLLQQAAWLYERQLSQVRAQMRKVVLPQSSTSSPTPEGTTGSVMAGGHNTNRGSSGAGPRVPSSLSIRSRDSPVPQGDRGTPSTPVKAMAPPMSRTSSTNTAIVSRHMPPSPRQHTKRLSRGSFVAPLRTEALDEAIAEVEPSVSEDSPHSPAGPGIISSSSSSSNSNRPNLRSQTFKRPPALSSKKSQIGHFADDEDEEEDPAFLPFSDPPAPTANQDPSATLRVDPPDSIVPKPSRKADQARSKHSRPPTQTAHSSASSASSAPAATNMGGDGAQNARPPPGPLSPRRAAELAGLSPRRRAAGKDGSDGSPSMGSSFSDLDDASVTQSALEEALLSNMQHVGVASRVSTISQALRSRYL